MSAKRIDGKAVAAEVRERVAEGVREFAAARGGDVPGLATVLVGDDPASHVYVGNKRKQTEEVGMRSFHHGLGAATPQDELLELVAELNEDDTVDGILVQLPLPEQIDQDAVIAAIDPAKDVDGLTATSAGLLAQGRPRLVPCTPRGVVELLRHAGTAIEGAEAVVLGRSILVGRPLAALLLGENATVTVCHSRTRDLAAVCSRADILVAAVGSAAARRRGDGQARGDGDRRRHQPHRGGPRRRRRIRRGQPGRRGDHAGAGRRRADDDRDAAREHAPGGLRASALAL